MIAVHEASVQDRDGAPEVILGMLEKAPQVTKLWADGGYAGPKLRNRTMPQRHGARGVVALRYIDDLELRQAIVKQLNKVGLANRFTAPPSQEIRASSPGPKRRSRRSRKPATG